MAVPERPTVRSKGFQKPQPPLKKTARERSPPQAEIAVDRVPVCAPEVAVEAQVVEVAAAETVSESEPQITVAPPEAEPEVPAFVESEVVDDTPSPAPAEVQAAASGGVRSKGFAKASPAVTPREAEAVESPAAMKNSAADYMPDLDAERVSRRQWWKHNLYVKSGRQAAEHPPT